MPSPVDESNVVEVDFARPLTFADIPREIAALKAEARAAAFQEEQWRRWDRHWLVKRLRWARAELAAERRASAFTDDDVLAALRECDAEGPVPATPVARRLFRGEPSHSAVIRVGHALGRLADHGRVQRFPGRDYRPSRWQAISDA